MKKHKKLIIIIALVAFIIVVPLVSFIVKKDNVTAVNVTSITKDVDNMTTLNGVVISKNKKDIFLDPTKGNNYTVNVKQGDTVAKGDTLISYNTNVISDKISNANDDIKQKKSQLSDLQKNISQLKSTSIKEQNVAGIANSMQGQKLALDEKISALKETIKACELNVKELKNQKNELTVKAPIDGLIVNVSSGSSPNNPIIVVESQGKIVKGDITEYELPKINNEMPVSLSFKALGSGSYDSKITNINHNPAINIQAMQGSDQSKTSNYEIDFEVPSNLADKVYDGFHCIVKIGDISNSIIIPKDCFYKSIDENTKLVWLIKDKKLVSQKISVKKNNGNYVLVKGLKEGDNIVNKASSNLKEGDEVSIK